MHLRINVALRNAHFKPVPNDYRGEMAIDCGNALDANKQPKNNIPVANSDSGKILSVRAVRIRQSMQSVSGSLSLSLSEKYFAPVPGPNPIIFSAPMKIGKLQREGISITGFDYGSDIGNISLI